MIREYKTEDREAVEKCLFELQEDEASRQPEHWETPAKALMDAYLDYLLKRIDGNEGKLFVADVDGVVAGCIAVIIDTDTSPCVVVKRYGYVPDLAVLRAYQKQGLGKELLAAAEEYTRAHGCDYLSLDVTIGNPAADFYKKSGYREYTINLKKKV